MKISQAEFQRIKAELHKLKRLRVTVDGGSMDPLLKHDEEIEVRAIQNLNELKPFEVIVFWHNDMLVCHMILRRNMIRAKTSSAESASDKSGKSALPFTTIGLGTGFEDAPILEEYILGKVDVRVKAWHKALLFWRWRRANKRFRA